MAMQIALSVPGSRVKSHLQCFAQGQEVTILRALRKYIKDEYKDELGATVWTQRGGPSGAVKNFAFHAVTACNIIMLITRCVSLSPEENFDANAFRQCKGNKQYPYSEVFYWILIPVTLQDCMPGKYSGCTSFVKSICQMSDASGCVALMVGQNSDKHPIFCRCPRDAPQQQNGYDCGVFVLVTQTSGYRAPCKRRPSDILLAGNRQKIVAEIMNGKLLKQLDSLCAGRLGMLLHVWRSGILSQAWVLTWNNCSEVAKSRFQLT